MVIERQPNFNRSDVLFEVLQHPRAQYWTDPRLLSQQPSERDLSRAWPSSVLQSGEADLTTGMLAFQGEAREGGPQVGTAIEVGCGIDLPCQWRLEAENTVLRH